MRRVFFKAVPWSKAEATRALEAGVDGLIVPKEHKREAQALARVEVVGADEVRFVTLGGKADEKQALFLVREGRFVVLTLGWEVIPVENLLAATDKPEDAEGAFLQASGRKSAFGVEVSSLPQAELAAQILEKGVEVIVVTPEGLSEIKKIAAFLKEGAGGHIKLQAAEIVAVSQVGMGHRVCVDTISLLQTGQGMLVGNSGGFFFLVHAETEASEYVAERPFRVNAGGVHSYCMGPGDTTSYLEELRAGSRVLVVDRRGNTLETTVGRVKIEQRPMLLVEAAVEAENGEVARGAVFLQNAETIRLVRENGVPVSVVELRPGDRVLCKTGKAGRHFGMAINETIIEE